MLNRLGRRHDFIVVPSIIRRVVVRRHFILPTVGTDGDVLPFIAIGGALIHRGHVATLVASEEYRDRAHAKGLDFCPLLTQSENQQLLQDPDFWHPLKGALVAAKWGHGKIEYQYELLAKLASQDNSVLVGSLGLLAARLVQEKLGTPMASLLLQPWVIASCTAPPVMPAYLTLPRRVPWPLGQMYWRAVDLVGSWLVGTQLVGIRRRLGLPRIQRFFTWWLSPQLALGMFPDWYGPPQADWPSQIRICGFPLDKRGGDSLEPKLLEFCRAGPAPVAFTFGTGMMHGQKLFSAAAEACRISGRRAIFLTRFAAQIPSKVPDSIRVVSYAPFAELFPHCAAVVHHGGIGTVSRALQTACPQLVLPLAFDQKDNAIRVRRLGAGDWIKPARISGIRIAQALDGLVSAEQQEKCAAIATRLAGASGLDAAATLLEQLGQPTDQLLMRQSK